MLGSAYSNLAGTLLLLERFDEAREIYERNLGPRRRLAERHPLVLDYQVGLGSALHNLGALEARRERPGPALPWFDQAILAELREGRDRTRQRR